MAARATVAIAAWSPFGRCARRAEPPGTTALQSSDGSTDGICVRAAIAARFAAASVTYSEIVVGDAPVAYYRLAEPSGLPQDAVGTNHATSVTGT